MWQTVNGNLAITWLITDKNLANVNAGNGERPCQYVYKDKETLMEINKIQIGSLKEHLLYLHERRQLCCRVSYDNLRAGLETS